MPELRKARITLAASFLAVPAAIPAAQPDAQACGTGQNSAVCMGTIDVPPNHRQAFLAAGRMTIDGLNSAAFAQDLRAFANGPARTGEHSGAWASVNIEQLVGDLRRSIAGQQIDTYGGLRGFFVHLFFGNLAYDGGTAGPILVNRAALPRVSESIANTISHEVAHRAGLTHPHSNDDLSIARCEPPYVIGSLIEKHAKGARWRPGKDDCDLL